MKRELRQYYLSVRKLLPCGLKQKTAFIRRLEGSIAAYVSEYPDADFTQIERHFGTPQQIAASYIEEMDPQEISDKLKARKRIFQIVAAAVTICVATWLAFVIYAAVEVENTLGGYYDGYLVIDDSTEGGT